MTAIREVREGDVANLLQLIRELAAHQGKPDEVVATDAQLTAALFADDPAAFAFVAEVDDELVGYALWFVSYSTWTGEHGIWLEDLYVRPSTRGSGLGRALIQRLARICVERGYTRLEWSVLQSNRSAIDFYRRIGAAHQTDSDGFRLAGARLAEIASDGAS